MDAKQWLEEMADLESRIAKIYERFAAQFREAFNVSDLWTSMSREELHHAELLSLAAGHSAGVNLGPSLVEQAGALRAVVTRFEDGQAKVVRLQEALQVTADLEQAEAAHLHAHLASLGDAARALVDDPGMQHQLRSSLEQAVEVFGTAELRKHMAWLRFRE